MVSLVIVAVWMECIQRKSWISYAGVEAEVHGLPELGKLTWRKSSSRPAGVIVKILLKTQKQKFCQAGYGLKTSLFFCLSDFHKTAPYVVTGSVDQTVKVWECR